MLNNIIDDNTAALVANGLLPDSKIIQALVKKMKFVIAIDGAIHKLEDLGIKSNIVIGDKDSILHDIVDDSYIHIQDQNTTDLEKGILFCINNNFKQALIIGAFGKELDHALNNMMLLAKYTDQGMKFIAVDQYNKNQIKLLIILTSEAINLTCKENSIISILPLPHALVSSVGLKWNLTNAHLVFDGFTSPRNVNIQQDVYINCHEGKVALIMDYDYV